MISTHVLNRRGKSGQEAGVALLGAYLPLNPTAWPCGRGGLWPHPLFLVTAIPQNQGQQSCSLTSILTYWYTLLRRTWCRTPTPWT